jgi:hypothetical protein
MPVRVNRRDRLKKAASGHVRRVMVIAVAWLATRELRFTGVPPAWRTRHVGGQYPDAGQASDSTARAAARQLHSHFARKPSKPSERMLVCRRDSLPS